MGTPQELSKIQKADIPNTNAREISRIHRMVHSTNKARGIGSTARNSAKRVMCNTELYGACSTTKGGDPRTGPPRHPGRNLRQYLVAAQVAREAAVKAQAAFDEAEGIFATPNNPTLEGFLTRCHISLDDNHTRAQRTPKRICVTAETVTGKEGSSLIGTTNRSLSDKDQQKNISSLNRISTIENRTTSNYYNQQKQDSQLLNRIV
ncbi:hypothetical protein PSTG_09717 [Puccinia striiformis f. sp. tritici PST-78]|uniref:Uncharacterized protein n=1 Tax=Puccinia striiformis f. sp. tritici PST-78 TaxID=1165861 RepID=A0A0L0VCQ7_9BASI|nr:hypothetical protein PSTG_09717 [Puccinia striiformis f. sp. tritici PST-78]